MGLKEDALAAYEDHHAHQKAEVREERIKQRARIAREAPKFLKDVLGVDAEITSWFNGVRHDERDGAVFDVDSVRVVYWRRQYAGNAQALYLLIDCPDCKTTVPKGGPIWNLFYLGQAILEGSLWSHDCTNADHRTTTADDRLVSALRDYVRQIVDSSAVDTSKPGAVSAPAVSPVPGVAAQHA